MIDPELRTRLHDQLRVYYRRHPSAMEPQAKDHSYLAVRTEVEKGGK